MSGNNPLVYHAVQTVPASDEYHDRVARNHDLLTAEEVARLLNSQAETIELLREWLREIDRGSGLVEYMRSVIRNVNGNFSESEINFAKRRLAALEGM